MTTSGSSGQPSAGGVRIAFVMDPLPSLSLKKDSTLAMIRAAQRRGWEIFFLGQGDMVLRQGEPRAFLHPLRLTGAFAETLDPADAGEGWYDLFFQYTAEIMQMGDGWVVNPGDPSMNSGILTSQGNADIVSGVTINLYDTDGTSDTFVLKPDGHRLSGDNETMVGRGWLSLAPPADPAPRGAFRAWLFIAIPSPGGAAVLAMGAGVVALRRRK